VTCDVFIVNPVHVAVLDYGIKSEQLNRVCRHLNVPQRIIGTVVGNAPFHAGQNIWNLFVLIPCYGTFLISLLVC